MIPYDVWGSKEPSRSRMRLEPESQQEYRQHPGHRILQDVCHPTSVADVLPPLLEGDVDFLQPVAAEDRDVVMGPWNRGQLVFFQRHLRVLGRGHNVLAGLFLLGFQFLLVFGLQLR